MPLRSLLLAALLAFAPPAIADDTRRQDFLVEVDGQHVGWASWRWNGTRYEERVHLSVRQGEGRASVDSRFQLDGGRFERRVRAGSVDRRETGRIEGGRVFRNVRGRETEVGTTASGTPLLPPMRLDFLRDAARAGAAEASLVAFDPDAMRFVSVERGRCPAAEGETCLTWHAAQRPVEHWHFAADGTLRRIDLQVTGFPLSLVACERDCARAVAAPLDVIARWVVASPAKIPRSAAAGPLRYMLVRADGIAPQLVATDEQAVVTDGARTIVTVCADCGDATTETSATLAPYLRANAWVQSSHAAIRQVARGAGGPDQSVDARMHRLVDIVRRRMRNEVNYVGYADAATALRTGRGDCTEYAVLLAALARAQGIPARVAVGMAYSSRFTGRRDAFSPHVWVQVHDGTRWRSFDAALDGFDATHVALAVGGGDPDEVFEAYAQLNQLRIERLARVERGPR